MTIQNIISKLLRIINSVENKKELELDLTFPIEFTFYHLLERIEKNLTSLDLLVNNDIIKHNHTIGLILRNLLSDFLLIAPIIQDSNNEDEMISKFNSIYNADLKKIDSYVKIQKDNERLSKQEFQTIMEELSEEKTIHAYIRKNTLEKKVKLKQPKKYLKIL